MPARYHAGHHARRYDAIIVIIIVTGICARQSRWERGVARMQAGGFADTQASLTPDASPAPSTGDAVPATSGSSNVVAEARRYLGGNPTGRGSLWCARFMNLVLQHTGYRGTGSDMANSFAHYGQRVSGPQVGAIAVMRRGAAAAMSASSPASMRREIRS